MSIPYRQSILTALIFPPSIVIVYHMTCTNILQSIEQLVSNYRLRGAIYLTVIGDTIGRLIDLT